MLKIIMNRNSQSCKKFIFVSSTFPLKFKSLERQAYRRIAEVSAEPGI